MTLSGAGRVLIVDDDADTRLLLAQACQTANYVVGEAGTGREALAMLAREPFDVMLLDLRLPDMDGVQVLDAMASSHPDVITIVLTANPTQDSAIAAIRSGVAEYLRKPLRIKQVLEAIAGKLAQRAQMQRRLIELGTIGNAVVGEERYRVPEERSGMAQRTNRRGPDGHMPVQLDEEKQEATIVGEGTKRIMLTKGETTVLAALLRRAGDVLSYQDLAFEAWGERLELDHATGIIRPLIFRLRQKLEPEPSMPRWIRTVRGVGYIFNPR